MFRLRSKLLFISIIPNHAYGANPIKRLGNRLSRAIFFSAFSLPLGRVPVKAGHSGVGSIAALIPYLSSNPPPADGVGFFTILSHVRRWLKLKTIEFLSHQLSSSPLEGVGGLPFFKTALVGPVLDSSPDLEFRGYFGRIWDCRLPYRWCRLSFWSRRRVG